MLDAAALPYRLLPDDGGWLENLRANAAIERAKRNRTAVRYPRTEPLDEYPLVPFLIAPDRAIYYDTTALGRWIDDVHPIAAGPLIPDDAALGFAVRLIDEAFDELGLYLVHHHRWVTSARDNDAGARLAHEQRRNLPIAFAPGVATFFARRQVRRLPYLFSVADDDFDPHGLAAALVPPRRDGFPPTHDLLDAISADALTALEAILTQQPFLFGRRFTLADASVYGQLGMNLKDPSAAKRMRELAPRTFTWLNEIRDRRHLGASGGLELSDRQAPLLELIGETFVPLMQQNEAAYERSLAAGDDLFNEAAFNRGRALYDGELRGQPFRSVAKTFQVRVWRELVAAWRELTSDERARLPASLRGFDQPPAASTSAG